MAVGAVQAVENEGKAGQVRVFGVDAAEDGIAAIRPGRLTGAVSQDTAGMGKLAIETTKYASLSHEAHNAVHLRAYIP